MSNHIAQLTVSTVYDEDDGDDGGAVHLAKVPPVSQLTDPQKPKPSLWDSFKEKEVCDA